MNLFDKLNTGMTEAEIREEFERELIAAREEHKRETAKVDVAKARSNVIEPLKDYLETLFEAAGTNKKVTAKEIEDMLVDMEAEIFAVGGILALFKQPAKKKPITFDKNKEVSFSIDVDEEAQKTIDEFLDTFRTK